jgi:outer membrane protein OmpA-like peptidoglycan-associated protein
MGEEAKADIEVVRGIRPTWIPGQLEIVVRARNRGKEAVPRPVTVEVPVPQGYEYVWGSAKTLRPGPDANPPAAGADLEAVGDGPLSSAQMERLASELRSLLGSDDTASVRLRAARLLDGVLPPLLEELELVGVLVDHAMGRPAAEDSVAAAFMAQWIQRERSGDGSPGDADAELVVRFEARSADLPPAALQSSAELPLEADRLYPVAGSADRGGETDGDASLPRRRAEAVAEVLLARNVPAGHVVVLTRPAIAGPVPTALGVAEPENRRVEVWVR